MRTGSSPVFENVCTMPGGTITNDPACTVATLSPSRVNREPVALVREEWRVVDRWWTEEPVHRRYFEVVLDGGQSTVVFRDEERGTWFSQRGA